MDQIMQGFFSSTTGIGMVICAILGYVFKRWPAFKNGFIPVIVFIGALITQVINHFGEPQPATTAMGGLVIMQAGLFSGWFVHVLVQAVLQTLGSVGAHSTIKNTAQALAQNVVLDVSGQGGGGKI